MNVRTHCQAAGWKIPMRVSSTLDRSKIAGLINMIALVLLEKSPFAKVCQHGLGVLGSHRGRRCNADVCSVLAGFASFLASYFCRRCNCVFGTLPFCFETTPEE